MSVIANFQKGGQTLILYLDDARIRRHLQRVEQQLRARHISFLPPAVQAARLIHLNRLKTYWQGGRFPRQQGQPRPGQAYAPCFIDSAGQACAVAHLIMASGYKPIAQQIAQTANYAYVEEMTFPELENWAAEAGFSQTELALIQPQYYCPEACAEAFRALLTAKVTAMTMANREVMMQIGLGGIAALLLQAIGIYRPRRLLLRAACLLGFMVGINLILFFPIYTDPLEILANASVPCSGAGVTNSCSLFMSVGLNVDINSVFAPLYKQIMISLTMGFIFLGVSLLSLLQSFGLYSRIAARFKH
jgi:hypothetical protein